MRLTPERSSDWGPVIWIVALERAALADGYVMVAAGTTKSKLKFTDAMELIFPPPDPSPSDELSSDRASSSIAWLISAGHTISGGYVQTPPGAKIWLCDQTVFEFTVDEENW